MIIEFLKGFAVGLGASIPLGPLGIMCVQKTLSKGRNSGLLTGMGAATSDTIFAALAILSIAFIQSLVNQYRAIFLTIGGIIVLVIGLQIFLTNPVKQIKQEKKSKRHIEDFFSAVAMTLSNPGALFLIIGLFALVGIETSDSADGSMISTTLSGVFLGATSWWVFLSFIINKFRKNFRLKQLLMINRISGIIIMVLGIISIFQGLFKLIM